MTSFRLTPPDDYGMAPSLYANYVQVTMSPHDFRLLLGSFAFPPLAEPRSGEVGVPIEPVASITLPLNLVRGLIRALETQAAGWEAAFKEPLPDQPQPTAESEGTT